MGLKIKQFKPLVVGAPRSGFTLLISVIMHLRQFAAQEKGDLRLALLRHMIDHVGNHMSDAVVAAFQREGHTHDLLFNPNFRYLPGGPKWLKSQNPELACFRKYIGVRGLGDFTLVTSHPRQLLDIDPVVHSHEHAGVWASHPGYSDYTRFASIRHPIGILNSAIHSINALASEYIQKFVPPEDDNDLIRQNLAIYKFTDLDFFEGLVRFLAGYLEEFVEYKDRYILMRWEDLISEPVPTILRIAQAAKINISEQYAREVWAKLDHVNLTGHHMHNYRVGHGKVGDWKFSITNTHFDIVKAYGIESSMQALGFEPLTYIDEKDYTPFQQRVQGYLNRGEVYQDFPDRDLFTFAFNKSNLISDKFPFQRYDWRTHTQVERSIFTNEALMFRVWDAAEQAVGELNAFLSDFLSENYEKNAQAALASLRQKHGAALGPKLTQAIDTAALLLPTGNRAQVAAKRSISEPSISGGSQLQPPDKQLELHFYRDHAELAGFLAQLIAAGRTRLRLSGNPAEIAGFYRWLPNAGLNMTLCASAEIRDSLPNLPLERSEERKPDIYLVLETDAEALSGALMEFVGFEDAVVLAPMSDHYFANRPLFLISIPKSGTHLLYELAHVFGYKAGVVCPSDPEPGTWYCVEHSNSHTSAKDFFVDTVRRSPFGNRDHPFVRSPAVFIYRNPLDIVVSEANYYHKEGRTAFSGYFAGQSFEERLKTLISYPWLLGAIRDRVGNFIPWMRFSNVIPVSFEEIIGASGQGDANVQMRLIWSLQLKLHVPGNARDFGELVFNEGSDTFHAGRIGAYRDAFTPGAWEALKALPQDFMERLGHDVAGLDCFPQHAEKFRHRPLEVPKVDFSSTAILVEANFFNYNIVRFQHRYIGIPKEMGSVELASASNEQILRFKINATLDGVKREILASGTAEAREPPSRIETDYLGFNIVRFKGIFFGIPHVLDPFNLESASQIQFEQMFIGYSAAMVKEKIRKVIQ